MTRTAVLFILSLAASAVAQSKRPDDVQASAVPSLTIPILSFDPSAGSYVNPTETPFDPSNALSYGPSTETMGPQSTTSVVGHSTHSSGSVSTSASTSPRMTTSAMPTSGSTSSTQGAAPAGGSGAAQANMPRAIGAVAGGLMAALVLV